MKVIKLDKVRLGIVALVSILLLSIFSVVFGNVVHAENNVGTHEISEEITIQEESFLENLKEKEPYLSAELEKVKEKGYEINSNVTSVGDSHVVDYHSKDGKVFGMIQISDDEKNTTLEVALENNNKLDFVKTQTEGAEEQYKTLEDLEKYNDSYDQQNSGVSTYAISDEAKSTICNMVIDMSGSAIGLVYSKVATVVGGPAAGFVVGLINKFGWDYLNNTFC